MASASTARNLRQKQRISYYEPEEPSFDDYVYCDDCNDFVYEYCAIHGPLLVIPDDKVPLKSEYPPIVPRAALTIPKVFLHLARSNIPGAGIGVFSTLTLPRGVRFGPYRGLRAATAQSGYCWQIYDRNNKPSHVVDAADAARSNWMRYVNCARGWHEQNLVAYQYQGELYYRTVKIIRKFDELLVFYGGEFARSLQVDLREYNAPPLYAPRIGPPKKKKPRFEPPSKKIDEETEKTSLETNEHTQMVPSEEISSNKSTVVEDSQIFEKAKPQKSKKLKSKSTSVKDKASMKIIGKRTVNIKKVKHIKAKPKKNEIKTTPKITAQSENDTNATENKTQTIFEVKTDAEIISLTQDQTRGDKKTETKDENNNINKFICNDCDKIFDTKTKLSLHMLSHDKKHVCGICEYKTNILSHLKSHLNVHAGVKRFVCNLCPYQSKTSDNLKVHLRTHTGEKPFSCNLCCFKCNQNSALMSHLKKHSGMKPFSCNICPYKSIYSGTMKRHIRTHTGEKPFSCNFCSYRCTQSGSLKKHLRLHKGETPFSCNFCSYKSTNSSNLKVHLRTHTGEKPFSCNFCSYRCTNSSSLNIHIKRHTGDKHFSCNFCSYRCTNSSNLKVHLRTHADEKPFSCNFCSYRCNRSSQLNTHIRRHTGEKPF